MADRMTMIRNKKVVITGGAGFIGSNLATALADNNEVAIVDDLSTGHLSNLKRIKGKYEFHKGSVTDKKILKKAFKGADYILHEAALCSVPRSIANPEKSNDVNINGTLQVLIAARDAGVKRVVFAASSSAYGNAATLPKKENMPTDPRSPYALTKVAGENYLRMFHEFYGLDTLSLRYFNIFGPFQDPNSQYSAVIPLFAKALLNKKRPVIFGDGKQSRDFTFVDNVVEANILACKAKKTKGAVVNIACGKRITLIQLVKELNSLFGTNLKPKFTTERLGDVKHSLADISSAKKIIGYEPKIHIREGLKMTAEYYKKTLRTPN